MKIILLSIIIFELYAIISIYAKKYLEKRYNKMYKDFFIYVNINLDFPKALYYPIHILLRKKYDMKYKKLYLSAKIDEIYFYDFQSDVIDNKLSNLQKELNKINRQIKLKKLK